VLPLPVQHRFRVRLHVPKLLLERCLCLPLLLQPFRFIRYRWARTWALFVRLPLPLTLHQHQRLPLVPIIAQRILLLRRPRERIPRVEVPSLVLPLPVQHRFRVRLQVPKLLLELSLCQLVLCVNLCLCWSAVTAGRRHRLWKRGGRRRSAVFGRFWAPCSDTRLRRVC